MAQPSSESSPGLFATVILTVLLVAGVFVGRAICAELLPEKEGAQMIAMFMLPIGIVVGLSFGMGTIPPMSVLNLVSVFDKKYSIEEVISRGGSAGGTLSLIVAMVLGTAATCAILAGIISVFMKPEMPMSELMMWFGGSGFVYALVMSGVVWVGIGE